MESARCTFFPLYLDEFANFLIQKFGGCFDKVFKVRRAGASQFGAKWWYPPMDTPL
jgi:hypothetical protein